MYHTVIAPLRVQQSKKKMFTLNLNVYRNAHFHVLNKAKIEYKEAVRSQVEALPQFTVVRVSYIVYPKTKRLFDISNVCCIHDKFFCDALVEFGKLPEDNFNHLKQVSYLFGGIDKDNPRVEILIEEMT